MSGREAFHSLKPLDDEQQVKSIVEAASKVDSGFFDRVSKGDKISDLSSNMIFDGLEISPDTIFTSSTEEFEAAGTVYLMLNYGGSRDPGSMTDSYPAVVRGKFGHAPVEINEIAVDTGGIYD